MIRFFFFELFNYEVNIIMYIDIRSHDKYLNGHIENAKNIGKKSFIRILFCIFAFK